MQQDPPTSQPHTPQIVDGVKPRGWVDHPAGLHFEYLGIADSRPTRTEYNKCWAHQREVHAEVSAHQRPNTVIYVEHDPVYTAGRRTRKEAYPFDGTPVVPVDRGGEITWHGPGQLVGYPIVFLQRGIEVLPSLLCNAGGLVASYFEWSMNKSSQTMTATEAEERLGQHMSDAARRVRIARHRFESDLRTAAICTALEQIERVHSLRGVFP